MQLHMNANHLPRNLVFADRRLRSRPAPSVGAYPEPERISFRDYIFDNHMTTIKYYFIILVC